MFVTQLCCVALTKHPHTPVHYTSPHPPHVDCLFVFYCSALTQNLSERTGCFPSALIRDRGYRPSLHFTASISLMPALICGPIQYHPHKICMNTQRISICHSTSMKSFMFIISQSNFPWFCSLHFFPSWNHFVITPKQLLGRIYPKRAMTMIAALRPLPFLQQMQLFHLETQFQPNHQCVC